SPKSYANIRDLHSFPTRRSSDLTTELSGEYERAASAAPTSTRRTQSPSRRLKRSRRGSASSSRSGWSSGSNPARTRDHPLLLLRSEEHTSELQSRSDLVCRLLLE